MGILGIQNRTENWKTVENFYALSGEAKRQIVGYLLGPYKDEDIPNLRHQDIKIELFWQGMRDHIDYLKRNGSCVPSGQYFASVYLDLFGCLKTDVEKFIERPDKMTNKFRELKVHNYVVGDDISVPKPQGKSVKAHLTGQNQELFISGSPLGCNPPCTYPQPKGQVSCPCFVSGGFCFERSGTCLAYGKIGCTGIRLHAVMRNLSPRDFVGLAQTEA